MPSLTASGCRIYRKHDGVIGIRAVRPVAIGDKYLYKGEFERLKAGQRFTICADDGAVLNEYEIRIYK